MIKLVIAICMVIVMTRFSSRFVVAYLSSIFNQDSGLKKNNSVGNPAWALTAANPHCDRMCWHRKVPCTKWWGIVESTKLLSLVSKSLHREHNESVSRFQRCAFRSNLGKRSNSKHTHKILMSQLKKWCLCGSASSAENVWICFPAG